MVVSTKVEGASRNDVQSVVWDAHPAKLKSNNVDKSHKRPNNPPSFLRATTRPTAAQSSLGALTTAALILPGLITPPPTCAAEGDEVAFQYSHYQEGNRKVSGYSQNADGALSIANVKAFSPIEVDSLHGSANISLTDRIKFAFNYTQDTWGGATPIATMPLASGNNNILTAPKNPAVKTGASPYLSPYNGNFLLDKNNRPVNKIQDLQTGVSTYALEERLVHTMAMASQETRKQGDFKLGYEWDEAAVEIGGGISLEDDYESRFGSINTRLVFNQKQTVLNAGLSYTHSDTHAILDHDAWPYFISDETYDNLTIDDKLGGQHLIQGTKQDWGVNLGLSQVLGKNALVEANLGYIRSTGYMENPYKAVGILFIDPTQQNPNTNCPDAAFGYKCMATGAVLEQRPDERNQWSGGLRYVQHIEPLDAAIHLGYKLFSDDWGISSHTFDADWVQPLGQGWTVTPRLRYYSQDAANFYTPYLTSNQGFLNNVLDNLGRQVMLDNNASNPETAPKFAYDPITNQYFDSQNRDVTEKVNNGELFLYNQQQLFTRDKFPKNYSSDHRLSGFGALSGGVTLSKQFGKGMALDLDFEYYSHQGSLKIGGGGEGSYADFDYWTANAALKLDLAALSWHGGGAENRHAHHQHSGYEPAGVMFAHLLPNAGDFMVGYRYQWVSQSGAMLQVQNAIADAEVSTTGCQGNPCYLRPRDMTMHMHMVELMYAPTDWLTLMLMPQFMDMGMSMRGIADEDSLLKLEHNLGGHYQHHRQNNHETGGIGDLGLYGLFKLLDDNTHHLHITAGFSAPTGDANIQLRRNHQTDGGFIHYGMQLGSGTWDFKPSLTYTGHLNDWSWGAQASVTLRMEAKNKSGYNLGDLFQATAWGGYNLTHWLTANVRGSYITQGGINGEYPGAQSNNPDNTFLNKDGYPTSILKFGPQDYPENYGGRFWDVGFGLSAMMPTGDFAGNKLSVEWLQPVYTNFNGYQLNRDGTLNATWSLMF